MGTGIRIFIEYDFSKFREHPYEIPTSPFQDDVSLWDLQHDFISAQKDYRFFAALAGVRNRENGIEPLFAPRGIPDNCHYYAARELQEEEPPISWLTAAELNAALVHASLNLEDLEETAQLIVKIVNLLARKCGNDRVRILFAFT